jgi:diaminopimelate decarboxylase
MSDFFDTKNGVYHAENVAFPRIAESIGTPCYVYSRAALQHAYRQLRQAFKTLTPLICFAVKANGNLEVIRTLAQEGAGADIVSAGEMQRALLAGVKPESIIFSGVGKTDAEITAAAQIGIYQFNAESVPELDALARVGLALKKQIPVALRINPDVDPRTHAKISTGQKAAKFGINLSDLPEALAKIKAQPSLTLRGIAVHIGSQLTSLEPFDQAFGIVAALIQQLRGEGLKIDRVDLGGGLGIRYANENPPSPLAYADIIDRHFGKMSLEIALEPGRSMVGSAGILLSKVIYAKTNPERNFLIIDAAMNDLVRPAMYDAWHDILAVKPMASASPRVWDVVGPICETSDLFGSDRELPDLGPGDLVAITCAGAYGAVMSSTYNVRALVPEVMVDGDQFALIRRSVTPAEQICWDVPPVWMR